MEFEYNEVLDAFDNPFDDDDFSSSLPLALNNDTPRSPDAKDAPTYHDQIVFLIDCTQQMIADQQSTKKLESEKVTFPPPSTFNEIPLEQHDPDNFQGFLQFFEIKNHFSSGRQDSAGPLQHGKPILLP